MSGVLITGGTGLVGKHLTQLLTSKGYEVKLLSRAATSGNRFNWNLEENYIDPKAFEGIDFIIHLAGAPIIDKKWTPQRKKEIINSRVATTKLISNYINENNIQLKAFVSSSAIGYYGTLTSQHIFTETDSAGKDFVAEVCNEWEKATIGFKAERIAILRIGIVLSTQGGALKKMLTPIITPLGSGNQYIPWIHVKDLAEMFLFAIENSKIEGVYNAVAPNPVSNKTFSKLLATVFSKPFISVSAPSFLLKLVLGARANLVLEGSRVSADKIQNNGFKFLYPELENAFKELKARN